MPRGKKPTLQAHIGRLLQDAMGFARTARDDIVKRADRIDALDSIMLCRKRLAEAEACIKETLPFKS